MRPQPKSTCEYLPKKTSAVPCGKPATLAFNYGEPKATHCVCAEHAGQFREMLADTMDKSLWTEDAVR